MRDDFSTPPGRLNKRTLFELAWLGSPKVFQAYVIAIGPELGLKAATARQQAPLVLNDLLSMSDTVRIGLPLGSPWIPLRCRDGAMSAYGCSLLEQHTDPKTWGMTLDWWPEDFARIADDYLLFDRALHLGFRLQYTQELLSPPDGAFREVRAAAVEPALSRRLHLRQVTRPRHVVVKLRGEVGLEHRGSIELRQPPVSTPQRPEKRLSRDEMERLAAQYARDNPGKGQRRLFEEWNADPLHPHIPLKCFPMLDGTGRPPD